MVYRVLILSCVYKVELNVLRHAYDLHKNYVVVESLVLNDDYDNRRQTTNDRKGIQNDIMVTVLMADTLLIAIELTFHLLRAHIMARCFIATNY